MNIESLSRAGFQRHSAPRLRDEFFAGFQIIQRSTEIVVRFSEIGFDFQRTPKGRDCFRVATLGA